MPSLPSFSHSFSLPLFLLTPHYLLSFPCPLLPITVIFFCSLLLPVFLSPSIYASLLSNISLTHSLTHPPSLYLHSANQNRFPLGTTLNIILNFSFLISAASFTLNLLPRAKKQHGIHETCTHHRKCDYSLSISLSVLLSHHSEQHGNRETCSHLRLEYFLLPLSCLLFPSPHPSLSFFLSPSIPFISFFPLARLASCYHSFSPHFNVSLSLPSSPSIFHSLMLRGNSLPPLLSLIHHHHHHPFLFFSFSLTHAHALYAHVGMHKSSLYISVTSSEQYR